MQMYEAVWRSDGERVGVFYMHAANEAVVLAEAKIFLQGHPEFLYPTGHLTLSIRTLSSAERLRGHPSVRKRSASFGLSGAAPERFRGKCRAVRTMDDTHLELRRSRRERSCADGAPGSAGRSFNT